MPRASLSGPGNLTDHGLREPLREPLPVNAVPVDAPHRMEHAAEGKVVRQVAANRPCQDVLWAILFVLGLAAALGCGVHEVAHIDAVGKSLRTCPEFLDAAKGKGYHVMGHDHKWHHTQNSTISLRTEIPEAVGILAAVFATAAVISVLYLFALEFQARIITWVSICMWPALVFCAGLYEFKMMAQEDKAAEHDIRCPTGNCKIGGVICMACSLPIALIICCKRAQIDLTAGLLSMSATAFMENRTLVVTTGLTTFVANIFFIAPLWLMTVVLIFPEDFSLAVAGCLGCDFYEGHYHVDGSHYWDKGISTFQHKVTNGSGVDPCAGVESEPPKYYFHALLLFMGIWVGMLAMELRVANVSGAIGLHYFDQDCGGNRSFQSMKWALTSNFGSLCYCSFLLTIVEIINRVVQKMLKRERAGNMPVYVKLVVECVVCLWRCVEGWVKYLTKMAVIALSITGQAFCDSAKLSSSLLARHNLDGIFIDAFAKFTLALFSLTVSLVFGFGSYWGMFHIHNSSKEMSIMTGVVGGIVAFVALFTLSGILLVVCNTHYMCYVMDLDHNVAPSGTTRAIHELYQGAIDRHHMASTKPRESTTEGKE